MSKISQTTDEDAVYRDDDKVRVHGEGSSNQRIIYLRHNEHQVDQKVVVVATSSSSFWSANCFAPFIGRGALSLTSTASTNSTDDSIDDDVVTRAEYLGQVKLSKADLYYIGVDEVQDQVDSDFWTSKSPLPASNTGYCWQRLALGLHFGEDRESKSKRTFRVPTEGGGAPLLLKICGALAGMQYDLAAVARVGDLVKRNLMTMSALAFDDAESASAAQWISGGHGALEISENGAVDHEEAARLISHILAEMLHAPTRRNTWVSVNSNEPVLLVNNLGGLTSDDLNFITSTVMSQLQQDWNIWPVRVYAGSFMRSAGFRGFSITVLNVVNTDIGGPSMIQLLDEPCEAAGWNNSIHREVWNGREMLLREVRKVDGQTDQESVPHGEDPPSVAMLPQESTSKPEAPSAEVAKSDISGAVGGGELTETEGGKHTMEGLAVPETQESESISELLPESEATIPSPTQVTKRDLEKDVEPETVERTDPFAGRPEVKYAPWQREHDDESLLDLVRKQAQKLHLTPEEEIKSGNDYAAIHPVPAELSGEEDYEVV